MKRIIVIGLNNPPSDVYALFSAAEFLDTNRNQKELATQLRHAQYDVFDMTKFPEKGDAFDHIVEGVDLVVALHLFAIGHIPKPEAVPDTNPYFYVGQNFHLLDKCMRLRIPLVCYGDQPWYGVRKKTKLKGQVFLYEHEVRTRIETTHVTPKEKVNDNFWETSRSG